MITALNIVAEALKDKPFYYLYRGEKVKIKHVRHNRHTGELMIENEHGALMPMALQDIILEGS